ncbi:MAG: hypothetical protein WBO24_01780 [Nitrospirales bacterium]
MVKLNDLPNVKELLNPLSIGKASREIISRINAITEKFKQEVRNVVNEKSDSTESKSFGKDVSSKLGRTDASAVTSSAVSGMFGGEKHRPSVADSVTSPQSGAKLESQTNPQALRAAEMSLSDHEITQSHMLFARRYASESAAKETIGEGAVNLDETLSDLKQSEQLPSSLAFKGDNYPTYDIVSGTEVASVKTHWSTYGELNESARRTYKQDFAHMLGWNRSPDAISVDGENILKIRDAGVAVPDKLHGESDPQAAGKYLRDNSILRIPDDHVPRIRDDIAADAQVFPENYFLEGEISEDKIANLTERIQGIGLESSDMISIIDRRMKSS